MPRFSKRVAKKPAMPEASLDLLVRDAATEASKANEVSQATRLDYEAKAKRLADGWDMEPACKKTRYAMRAAGLWVMRRELKRVLREADKLRRKGATGTETFEERNLQWAAKLAEAQIKLTQIAKFTNLPWAEIANPKQRAQASHKQKPATDAQLAKFYAGAGRSSFLQAFLVAEFSGCRGDEFGRGVRVEAGKENGIAVLRFFIESSKADGDKKGLAIRQINVPMPSSASDDVQKRWLALATAAAVKGGIVVTIEPTEKRSAGIRFTRAVATFATKASLDISAYSFRHRFSAQVKQSSGGDSVSVALAMGHQTTDTQRHYARAGRGGKGVSPVAIVGVNVSGHEIRGAAKRAGPPRHKREQTILGKAIGAAVSVPKPRRL